MIATTIEQSKKLLEIGIDSNTADMCWSIDIPDLPTLLAYPITDCDNLENKIPAWSLGTLMELMPKNKLWYLAYNIEQQKREITFEVSEENDEWHYEYADTYLDAAVEMVCWLKENKYI